MNSRAVEPVPMPITPSEGSSASAASAAWRLKSSVIGYCRGAQLLPRLSFANAIVTHRDVDYTACPGDAGYSVLGSLRSDVEAGIVFPP